MKTLRWRAALATALLHGGLLAGLLSAGNSGPAGRESVPLPPPAGSLSVRLLAAPPPTVQAQAPLPPPLPSQALRHTAFRPAGLEFPDLPDLPDLAARALPTVALAVPTAAPAPTAQPEPSIAAPPALRQASLSPPLTAAGPSRPAERSDCPPALYPPLLRERGVEGLVRVRVQVGPQGQTLAVQLAAGSGYRLLDEAALAQARACRWRPALADGQQIASWVEFPSRFSLQ